MSPRTLVWCMAATAALQHLCHAADLEAANGGAIPFTNSLEEIREKANLPALGAAAWIDGKIVEIAVTGVRRAGGSSKATIEDRWHIGSCTKAMTATLAAEMVDEGKIRWGSTVGEVLGDMRDVRPEWKGVTLEQLLQHRAGVATTPPPDLWAAAWKQVGTPVAQRNALAQGLLSRPLESPPGSKYQYSNQGYAIAGVMLERIARKPWETLIRERVFGPLGMKSSGFGAPGTPRKDDQPLGHQGPNGLTPVEVGPAADNPPAIGPAGTVHCSMSDLVRYAGWHATGNVPGGPSLPIKPETLAKIHQAPEGGDYAMGWVVAQRSWAGGVALTHTGSNTMWLTVIWVVPEKHAAFVAVTNAAPASAFGACDAAASLMIKRLLK